MEFLQKKLKGKLPYDPAIPFLGIYPRKVSQQKIEIPTHPCYCSTNQSQWPNYAISLGVQELKNGYRRCGNIHKGV
jgi:hypothetical protein